MALQIGDTAPDFEAETTEGRISFHDWLGDSWGVLFSHPRAFTPVCTTELGYMASIKPEFDKRNVKIIGLSVDPVDNHAKWAQDIEETQGTAPNYPMIGDSDFNVSKLYGMLPADVEGEPTERTPADEPDRAQRLRRRARQEDQADPRLSHDDRAQLRRGPARDRLAAADGQPQGRHAGPVAAGRRRDHRRLGLRRGGARDLPRRLGVAAALHPHRPASRRGDCPHLDGRRPARGCRRLRRLHPRDGLRRIRPDGRQPRRLDAAPRRRRSHRVHHASLWDSVDAIKAFAGEDIEAAVLYPEDERYLIDGESSVTHYEVVDQVP